MILLFVAMTKNRVIGVKGELPWRLSSDLKRFKELTTGHPVIMGRATYDSIPAKFRPLPGRTNIILTRDQQFQAEGCKVAHSLDEAVAMARQAPGGHEIFVIGGGQVYAQALPLAERIYLTEVDVTTDQGDTFFPEIDAKEWVRRKDGSFQQDDKNEYSGTFYILERRHG